MTTFSILFGSVLSVYALVLILLFFPARLLPWPVFRRWHPHLTALAYQGRWFGLAAAFLYTTLIVIQHTYFPFEWQMSYFFEAAALVIFTVLTAISNKWSYAHITYWKHLNMLIWLIIPFNAGQLILQPHVFGTLPRIILAIVLFLCAIGAISGLYEPKRGYFARHRLWLLLAGSAITLTVISLQAL